MTDPILDIDQVRSAIETSLDDAGLQLQIDGALALVESVAGPVGAVTEERRGGSSVVLLGRRYASIESVTEGYATSYPTVLATDDWELGPDGRSLTRRGYGTNPAAWFSGPVRVVGTAEDDVAIRRLVALQLIKHNLATTPGVLGFTEGNWSIQFPNGETWSATQADLLGTLRPLWSFG